MPSLRIAGSQMCVTTDIGLNAARIKASIDWAADQRADILLTPEGSLSGYTHHFDAERVAAALVDVTGLAAERGLGLALGTCFVEADGCCYNQLRFYTAAGTFLGFHSKTLCCGSLGDPSRGEIEHFAVSELRTFVWSNGIRIGGLICNDLWANPQCTPMPDSHLTQQLSRQGAQIVFHAVNGGRSDSEWSRMAWHFHDTNLRMRAIAGGLWVASVDNAEPTSLPCSAPCGVVGPDGTWVCRTPPQGERRFVHTVEVPTS